MHLKRVLDILVLLLIYILFIILITTSPSNLLDSILFFKTQNGWLKKGFVILAITADYYEEIKLKVIV
jgi:hypothetical protein